MSMRWIEGVAQIAIGVAAVATGHPYFTIGLWGSYILLRGLFPLAVEKSS